MPVILKRKKSIGSYYHQYIEKILKYVVPPNKRVLEVGCGQGDLLAALSPTYGVGIDFSPQMIARAKKNHPRMKFVQADAHEFNLKQEFDFIILSDLLNDLWDVQKALEQVRKHATSRTRIIINSYSRLWEWPLTLVRKIGLAKPNLLQNWLTVEDISGLLSLAGFEVVRNWEEIIWPIKTPVIDSLMNRFFAKIWPFRWFALTHFIVARPSCITKNVKRSPFPFPVCLNKTD